MARLKMIFTIIVLLIFMPLLKAQNFKAQGLFGMNVAQVDGDSYGGYNQPGIVAGFGIFRPSSKNRIFGYELLYSQKGSHKKTSEDDPYIFKLRYNYLCMPLFVEFSEIAPSLNNIKIRVAVSPNLKITSKVDYGYGWQNNSIRPFEISGLVSLNYKIDEHFGVMFRIENSILSIGTPAPNQYYRTSRRGLYNRLVSFMVSYDL